MLYTCIYVFLFTDFVAVLKKLRGLALQPVDCWNHRPGGEGYLSGMKFSYLVDFYIAIVSFYDEYSPVSMST